MPRGTTFISYARADGEFALKLAADLRAVADNIWIDQLELPAGVDWDEAIEQALEDCTTFLVVLSPASRASRNVRNEIAFSVEEGKNIIPVLHQKCKIPLNLIRRNWIDFTGDYDAGFKQLLRALGVPLPEKEPSKTQEMASPALKRKTAKAPQTDAAQSSQRPEYNLRSSPAILSADDVKAMLKKHDFYCGKYDWTQKWSNESGTGIHHEFQKKGEVVHDAATGLTWQQSGSSSRMLFKDAQQYIQELSDNKFAGYSDWRLPTLEEAMSLMEPKEGKNGLYIDPMFDKKQRWIWTADKDSASRAWVVVFDGGYCVDYGVYYGYIYVRAVR